MTEIRNSRDFRRWSRGRPREVNIILAARAALRTLPLVQILVERVPFVDQEEAVDKLILPLFQALSYSITSSLFSYEILPNDESLLIERTILSLDRGMPLAEMFAATASAAIIASSQDKDAVINNLYYDIILYRPMKMPFSSLTDVSSASVDMAANAMDYLDASETQAAYDSMWNSLSSDVIQVESLGRQGGLKKARAVFDLPLWHGAQPDAIAVLWENLKNRLLNLDSSWIVWTSWYEDRCRGAVAASNFGRHYDKLLDREKFIHILPEDWMAGWRVVNQKILNLEALLSDDESEVGQFQQGPAPHYFEYREGTLRLAAVRPELTVGETMRDDTWASVVSAVANFHERRKGSNAHVSEDLLEILSSLTANLGVSANTVRPGTIQSDWRRLKRETERVFGERGTGSSRVDGALQQILDALDDFRGCFKDCRAIESEGIRLGITARNVDSVLKRQAQLAWSVESLPDQVVDVSAKAAQSDALRQAQAEPDPFTRAELAADQALTQRNMASVVRNELKDLGRKTWEKSKDSISDGVAGAAGSATKWGLRLLAFKILGPIVGLAGIVEGFGDLAKKFEKLDDQGVFRDFESDQLLGGEADLEDSDPIIRI